LHAYATWKAYGKFLIVAVPRDSRPTHQIPDPPGSATELKPLPGTVKLSER